MTPMQALVQHLGSWNAASDALGALSSAGHGIGEYICRVEEAEARIADALKLLEGGQSAQLVRGVLTETCDDCGGPVLIAGCDEECTGPLDERLAASA